MDACTQIHVDANMYMCAYVLTYVSTYMRTYIHVYRYAYRPNIGVYAYSHIACIHTQIQTDMRI